MGLAAVLLSIAGYVLVLSRFTRWPVATLPAVVTSTIVLILYAGGLAGVLKPAAWLLFLGGGVALAGALVPPRQGSPVVRRTVADPGIAVLLLCGLLFWLRMRHAAYHNWDEFSHWGVVTKEILRLDGLPVASSPLKFLSYPPGAALFQYYLALFAGYSEGVTIFAQAILTLSTIAILLQAIDWSRSLAIAAIAIGAVLLVVVLGNGLKNILIDHLVAVYFGGALAMFLLAPQRDIGAALRALPLLMALPLLKAVGLMLAIIAALIIAVLAAREWPRARWMLAGAVLVAAPYLANLSWAVHVRDAGFTVAFAPTFSLVQLAGTVADANRAERDTQIITSFVHAWWEHSVQKSGWSSITWIVVLVATFVLAGWRAPGPERRREILIVLGVLVAGCAIYGIGLLMLYLYSFSEYEAIRSRQFGRYLSIYLLGWAWVGLAFLRDSRQTSPQSPRARLITQAIGAAALAALVFLAPIPTLERSWPAERPEIRLHALEASRRIAPDRSVFIIYQGSKGQHYWVLRAELLPRRVNADCWAVGKPWGEDDAWTCNLPPEKLSSLVRGFDYVLVAHGDAGLTDAFAPLTGGRAMDRDWQLFAVESTAQGVRLRPL